jgi:hypothetical protein
MGILARLLDVVKGSSAGGGFLGYDHGAPTSKDSGVTTSSGSKSWKRKQAALHARPTKNQTMEPSIQHPAFLAQPFS